MSMLVSTGAAMVLTAASLSAYGWASACDTCFSVSDGGFGSLLTVSGVLLVFIGSLLERRTRT